MPLFFLLLSLLVSSVLGQKPETHKTSLGEYGFSSERDFFTESTEEEENFF